MAEIGLAGYLLDRPHSGSAVYASNLAAQLPIVAPDLDFRLFVHEPELLPRQDSLAIERLGSPVSGLESRGAAGARLEKLWWETVSVPVAAKRRNLSLLHSLYFAAPVVTPCPLLVTIHDMIPLVLPGYHRSAASRWYSRLMAWTASRADAIVTVSIHARDEIVRVLGVPEERVYVTYEAASSRFSPHEEPEDRAIRDRLRLPERYVLYIGGSERRKNVAGLVRIWSEIAEQMREREVQLVIVADFPPPDALYPDVPRLVRELALSEDVLLIPRVTDEEQVALYRGALCLAFPSLYEGFGFTPLEAMACGAPVVVSNRTSLPEVVADGGLLLDPDDSGGWAQALLSIADSAGERERLRSAGLRRAAQFSWDQTARETADVYRQVLGR